MSTTDVALVVLAGLSAFAVFAVIGVLVLVAGYLARIAIALEADLEPLEAELDNVYGAARGPEGVTLTLAPEDVRRRLTEPEDRS